MEKCKEKHLKREICNFVIQLPYRDDGLCNSSVIKNIPFKLYIRNNQNMNHCYRCLIFIKIIPVQLKL